MRIKIKRVSIIDSGAFGVIMCSGSREGEYIPFAITLEHTYEKTHPTGTDPIFVEQNLKIPAGIYQCTRTLYDKGNYETFEIHVPGHSRILFHKGNTEDDVDGCIAVAEEFGILKGRPAILQSGTSPNKGFNELINKARGFDWFDLVIE